MPDERKELHWVTANTLHHGAGLVRMCCEHCGKPMVYMGEDDFYTINRDVYDHAILHGDGGYTFKPCEGKYQHEHEQRKPK